jgi:S-DNA-T family DNA segregation ATPase FtsK/SpoIIIE
MASYQVRQRERLLDSKTQAVIERRSKELLGVALLVLAVLTALVLGTYVPDDPSWLSATSEPAQNFLGRGGASIASPLFIIVGWGAWGLPLVFGAWGLRFVLHRGSERALSRVIFAPIAIALAAVYASTHVPSSVWTHSFGLGGLFGDTVLGATLSVVPLGTTFGLKLLALLVAVAAAGMTLFVLGCTMAELRGFVRFLGVSVVLAYNSLLNGLNRGASGALTGAAALRAARAERAEQRRLAAAEAAQEEAAMAAEMDVAPRMSRGTPLVARRPAVVHAPEPLYEADEDDWHAAPQPEPGPEPEAKGLRLRLPALKKKPAMPEPELVETAPPAGWEPDEDLSDDRIKARIADVIKSRVRAPVLQANRTSEAVAKRRGPRPMLLNNPDAVYAEQAPGRRLAEPPLTAAHAGEPALRTMEPPLTAAAVPPAPPVEPQLDPQIEPQAAPQPAAQPAPAFQRRAAEPETPLVAEPLFDAEDEDDTGWRAPAGRTAAPLPPHIQARSVVQHSPRRPAQPSQKARTEAQPSLQFEKKDVYETRYETPPLSLLSDPSEVERHHLSDDALEQNARMLESVLDDYGVKGEIVSVRPGPVVTMYELEPAPGLKASRVIGLADDIARSMSALSARVSTVPGRSVIGIELPNEKREMVNFREILSGRDYGDGNHRLPLALGKDIGGEPVVANLAKMPHLLIAGTTGSGKSVAINTMILSLLYKLTPDECRLIMIDPKMLELSVYDGIPHLLSPVVTDPKKAVVALKWVVGEMEERYRRMSKMGVRNIEGYNGRVKDALSRGEMFSRTVQTGFDDETGDPVFETEEFAPESLPYIVVIVDEMADLMMVAGKEIEACIQRLAQMARASGIHLIMATQRPSVDVITGTIKANFPTRISFQVTSKIDSRTILGEQGAEQLLGMGDMLYMAGGARITRVHGPFCSDEEVEEIVNYLKAYGPPDYVGGVVEGPDEDKESNIDLVLGLGGNTDGDDALYDQAVAVVIKDRKCSTSYIQRKLAIGYNKAARLVEQMEEEGLVSPANHVGKREILVPEQQ